jgi:hypothetical protein
VAQVVGFLLLIAVHDGAAAEPGPVVFVDQRPLAVDLDALRKSGGLEVTVRNTSDVEQAANLRVVNLAAAAGETDPVIRGLFPAAGVTKAIPAGGEETLLLPAQLSADAAPKSGTYTGVVTASGGRGDLDRRDLTITVKETTESPSQGSRLAAEGIPDVTLTATNFIPSIFMPLGPALFAFALIALLLTLIFWSSLSTLLRSLAIAALVALGVSSFFLETFGSDPSASSALHYTQYGLLFAGGAAIVVGLWGPLRRWKPVVVGVGAALLIATALVATKNDELEDGPATHLIASKSIPVAAGQSTGFVGVAVTQDSDIAELNVSGSETSGTGAELRALGLDRAGAYTGKIDLSQGVEGGEAKATINVRDWWPWALITLALGVGLGYLVRRYFEERRPRLLAERDANREWQRISDADSEWQYRADGKPYLTYTWIPLAQAWRAEIDRLLADDPKKASTQIEALRTYGQGFENLRSELITLDAAAAKLAEVWNRNNFGITDRAHVDPLRLADGLLSGGDNLGTSVDFSAAQESLTQRRAGVAKRTELCAEARRVLLDILDQIETSRGVDQARAVEPQSETTAELEKAARRVLHAKELSDVLEAEKLVETQADALEDCANTLDEATLLALDFEDKLPAGGVIELAGARTFRLRRKLAIPEPRPAAEIACVRYSTTKSVTTCTGDVDDLFALTARISAAESKASYRVAWDFDDRSKPLTQIAVLTDGKGDVTARHQFTDGGQRVVRLVIDGNEIATQPIDLSEVGLVTSSSGRFNVLDRQMTLLAGLIAVGSGMLAIYFSDAAWGQPQDYLQAILWGGVVAEGVKLTGALVARVWPGS